MRIAAIDCGTNTVHLIVAEIGPEGVRVVDHRVSTPRLGRGLARTGRLDDQAQEEALRALQAFRDLACDLGAVRLLAVGTEAIRAASNAQAFRERAWEANVPLRTITGEEEARLAFLAACHAAGGAGEVTMIDLGGGSTELVIGRDGKPLEWASLPFGSTYLTERFADSGDFVTDVREAVGQAIAGAPEPRGTTVLLGGTATTIARFATCDAPAHPVGGARMAARDFLAHVEWVVKRTEAELASYDFVEPERAKVLRAGALALDVLVDRPAVKQVVVTPYGLCWGLLLDAEFGPEAAGARPA